MDALRRASGSVFYLLGTLTIVAIVLVSRGMFTSPLSSFLSVIDLPLLLSGMIFGGSTLVASLSRGKPSTTLVLAILLPLLIAFAFFAWMNFAMPFMEV